MQALGAVGSGDGQPEGAAGERAQMALSLNGLQSQPGDLRLHSEAPGMRVGFSQGGGWLGLKGGQWTEGARTRSRVCVGGSPDCSMWLLFIASRSTS